MSAANITIFTGIHNSTNGVSAANRISPSIMCSRPASAKVLVGQPGLATHERVLPDEENITSRCLTGAWEEGVDVVGGEVVPLLKLALQVYIITQALSLVKCYIYLYIP